MCYNRISMWCKIWPVKKNTHTHAHTLPYIICVNTVASRFTFTLGTSCAELHFQTVPVHPRFTVCRPDRLCPGWTCAGHRGWQWPCRSWGCQSIPTCKWTSCAEKEGASKRAPNKSWSCCTSSSVAETTTTVLSGGRSKLIVAHWWKPQADKVAKATDIFSTYFDQKRNQCYISCFYLPLLLYQFPPLIICIWF